MAGDQLLATKEGRDSMLNITAEYLSKLGGCGLPIGIIMSSLCRDLQLLGAS